MKNIFGSALQICLFGESHGAAIGVVMDGLAPGIPLDLEGIRRQLDRRRAKGNISTARRETDAFQIVSGFFEGYTTGTPLCLLIPNQDQHSKDYEKTRYLPRPSHADYTAQAKYLGYQDYRGGGHFSGRITAPLVAAGAICQQILREKGIRLGTHIARCGGVDDEPLPQEEQALQKALEKLDQEEFPALSLDRWAKMVRAIQRAHEKGDSVGGILETAVVGMPAGVGEPFFDSVESTLSHLLFSVPAVKGVEFGLGFGFADQLGSQANDPFRYENGRVITATNHNGGINGGITNGMPLVVRTVVKPTPSIYLEQETVDLREQKNTTLQIQGRHDPAILHRARAVVDAVTAIGLVDLFAQRYGTLWMRKNP